MSKSYMRAWRSVFLGVQFGLAVLSSANGVNAAELEPIPKEFNLCVPNGFTIGFFNGVGNTLDDARKSLSGLRELVGDTHKDEPVEYELFYNDTGSENGKSIWVDLQETFIQRSKLIDQSEELGAHMELFWESSMEGRRTFLEKILAAMKVPLNKADDYIKDRVQIAGRIHAFLNMSPTDRNYAEHRAAIDRLTTEGQKMLFVAHSQGNLFVDKAFSYAKSKYKTNSVNVVHVAPPFKSLRGPYVLADIDMVIALLNLTGSSTVPPTNMDLPFSRKDPSGHGFMETYLDGERRSRAHIHNLVVSALDYMEPPVSQGHKGFFTTTLTWDGPGDVDLHIYEPGTAHVYYLKMDGDAGALDVDNRVANGPEHYYASCDSRKLQGGAYIIGVNNFKGADGRKATVHVSFSRGGPTETREIMLDPQQGRIGDHNPQLLLNLFVSKQPNGKWKAESFG